MSKMFNKGKNIYFYAILNMSVLTRRNFSFLDQNFFPFAARNIFFWLSLEVEEQNWIFQHFML